MQDDLSVGVRAGLLLDEMSRIRKLRSMLVVAGAAGLLLVGCVEEAPGPQFASDPLPSRTPTEPVAPATPSPRAPAATPVAIATPASLGELVVARGAPDRVFVASDQEIWSVTSDGDETLVFETLDDERLLSFAPSPSAHQVAVLIESGPPAARVHMLLVFDDTGEEVMAFDGFEGPAGTPVARASGGADHVDWSPQGRKALVSLEDGSLFTVELEDGAAPARVDVERNGAAILDPAWSPTGEAIAFILTSEANKERALAVYSLGSGRVTDAVQPEGGRFVVEFTWMPDGVSLLFTEGGDLGGAVTGIDLWRIGADGSGRTLVASAGSVAPVARIVNARPSPDGQRVAYAVLVPGSVAPHVESVWVRDLTAGIGFTIPMPQVESVEDIWWTDQGIVTSVVTRGSTRSQAPILALLKTGEDGVTDILWAAPIVQATPVGARLQATPEAG